MASFAARPAARVGAGFVAGTVIPEYMTLTSGAVS